MEKNSKFELEFGVCLNMLLFILLAMKFSAKLDIFNYNVRYKAWLLTCCFSNYKQWWKIGRA